MSENEANKDTVMIEIPEWLFPHYTTYAMLLNQTVAVVLGDEPRRWLSPMYINERRLHGLLHRATGINPAPAIRAMIDNGLILHGRNRGYRIIRCKWHEDNIARCCAHLIRTMDKTVRSAYSRYEK